MSHATGRPTVVSLFDLTGHWAQPWANDGRFDVFTVDLQSGGNVLDLTPASFSNVKVVLAAPPCTHFTTASTRHWPRYDVEGSTAHSTLLVNQTLKLIDAWRPKVWGLENPKAGRLKTLVPRLADTPRFNFDPYMYAGYLDQEALDPGPGDGSFRAQANRAFKTERYRKGTAIYGECNTPTPMSLDPLDTELGGQTAISSVPPGPQRANIRSATPRGFAYAFYLANVERALA